MKILIANTFYYPNLIGGAEHSVKNLAETLVKLNHEVHVVCIGEEEVKEELNGVTIHRIRNVNIQTSLEYHNNSSSKISKVLYRGIDLYGTLNKKKIKGILENLKPDIVHVNNFAGFGLDIFNLLKKKGIPSIFTARDYYTLCPNARLMKNNGDICIEKNKLCKMYEKVNKNIIKKVDHVTAPSKFTINLLKNSFDLSIDKTSCIYNSIEVKTDEISNVFNEKKNKIQDKLNIDIVFLGWLDSYKGIDRLIRYCINISELDIRLHIAGEGPLKEKILEYEQEFKNIKFYGKLNEEDLKCLLQDCDILAAPSMWYEPFGRIVLDAYKNCIPVISTGNGGLGELIKHGKTGYIISFESQKEFEEVIFKYRDKKLLLKHIENCKNEIVKYSNDYIAKQYELLYENLLKSSTNNKI